MRLKYKYIAIDFDGTIAEDSFPELGAIKPYAAQVIKKVADHGGQIAIWTCRAGVYVNQIKELLNEYGIPYHTFNEPFPEQLAMFPDNSRKIFADVYIDDRSLHAKEEGIDWLDVERRLFDF